MMAYSFPGGTGSAGAKESWKAVEASKGTRSGEALVIVQLQLQKKPRGKRDFVENLRLHMLWQTQGPRREPRRNY